MAHSRFSNPRNCLDRLLRLSSLFHAFALQQCTSTKARLSQLSRMAFRRPRFELLENRITLTSQIYENYFDVAMAALPSNIDFQLATYIADQEARDLAFRFSGEDVDQLEVSYRDFLSFDEQERPLVNVWTKNLGWDPSSRLESIGATVVEFSQDFRVAVAAVSPPLIATIAAWSSVLSVTPVFSPFTRAGSVQTQGDSVLNSDDVRNLGFDGTNIVVGVLSDSALNIANSQSTIDLPNVIDRYLEFPATDEGRAILEIIHDIAPGAKLAHHSAILSELSFASGIRTLADSGAKVIVDDVGYYTEPFFQDGIVAQSVDEVSAKGVAYFSAAGNDAAQSYETLFVDNDGSTSVDNHDFDPSAGVDTQQKITIPTGKTATLILQWDDPFYTMNGVTRNFDVRVYDLAGNLVVSGLTNNVSTQQPLEIVRWTSAGTGEYQIEIQRTAGEGASFLKYILSTNGTPVVFNEYGTNSSTVYGHAAASGAIAIGAVPYFSPDSIEPFSSRGDTKIVFDSSGNRLPSPVIRFKPDLVAPDQVNTTFFGEDIPQDLDTLPNFSGTSAAAPHAAAVAAQLLDANPNITLSQLRSILSSSAVDLGLAGRDSTFGHGRVDAQAALTATLAAVDSTNPTAVLRSPKVVNGWSPNEIVVQFSEPLNNSRSNVANYRLSEAGVDQNFGTADDINYTVSIAYDTSNDRTKITPIAPNSILPIGRYRIKLDGTNGLRDPAGNSINNAQDQLIEFFVSFKSEIVAQPQLIDDGTDWGSAIDVRPDGKVIVVHAANPIVGNDRWPQIQIGQYDLGGSTIPYRIAPTDIHDSFRVENVDVAVSSNAGIAVYSDYEEIVYQDPDWFHITYQRIDGNGRPLGNRTLVSGTNAFSDRKPSVAMNESGAVLVGFPDVGYASNQYTNLVKGRLYDSAGNALGNPFQINDPITSSGYNINVAMADDGSSTFIWENNFKIFQRRYDAAGVALSDVQVIASSANGYDNQASRIAMSPSGAYVVSWQSSVGPVAQRFSDAGIALGEPVTVFQGGTTGPEVSMADDGRFIVAWRSLDGDGVSLFAQRFNSDGSFNGSRIWVNGATTGTILDFDVAMRENGDFCISWSDANDVSKIRWYDWDAPSEDFPFGPAVRSLAPQADISTPFSQFFFTFDKPVDPTSLTASDIQFTDPFGRPITATGISSTDNLTFAIQFAEQRTPGQYTISLGTDVTDFGGRKLNQNGNGTSGETTDNYSGRLYTSPTDVAGVFPFFESFETGSLDDLAEGWAGFGVAGNATTEVSTGTPHSGSFHLRFKGTNQHYAILKLDLASLVGANDLVLDFWAWRGAYQNNYATIALSGDGTSWSNVVQYVAPAFDTYTHHSFDLDEILAMNLITLDDSVFIKFTHVNFHDYVDFFLDDVRVRQGDGKGPRLLNHSPAPTSTAPLTSFTVTFDEDIDSSSFQASDVTVKTPTGFIVPVSEPIDSGDHRTFTINLVDPQLIRGVYQLVIGPDIRDLAGNEMNQDNDATLGQIGSDVYRGTIVLGPVAARLTPYSQGFEGNSLSDILGWSFSTTDFGTIQLDSTGPHSGSQHLRFSQTASGNNNHEATLKLNLTAQAGASDLILDFWARRYEAWGLANYINVSVSGDSLTWFPIATGLTPKPNDIYGHFSFDLDEALNNNSIAFDNAVFLKFNNVSSVQYGEMTLDDVRVRRGDGTGPRLLSHTPTGPLTSPWNVVSVVFDEDINLNSFTAEDVVIIDPAGRQVAIVGTPIDSGDHRTFTINLASSQSLNGIYKVKLGPNITDLAGNEMDQDQDGYLGETNLDEDIYSTTIEYSNVPNSWPVLPFIESFERNDLSELVGWSYLMNQSSADLVTIDNPYLGNKHLQFIHTGYYTATKGEVSFGIDLSNQTGATNLVLDLWAKENATNNYLKLLVSNDGVLWNQVGTSINPDSFEYQHYVFDLDSSLSTLGIILDSDVFFKLEHWGYNPGSRLEIDNLRIRQGTVNHTPILPAGGTITGATEDVTKTIAYDNLADLLAETDSDADELSFLIDSIVSGSITKNGLPVVPGQTLISTGESLEWKASQNDYGIRSAFTLRAFDGDLVSSTARLINVEVSAVNDSPQITIPAGFVDYVEDTPPVSFATNSTVEDVDSLDFLLGQLTVSISVNSQTTDVVVIENQGSGIGQIGVVGNQIQFGGVTIGTFLGGSNNSPLVISLLSGANSVSVQALLRALQFQNTSHNPSSALRTISLVLSDGDGGSSTPVIKRIRIIPVNDPPVIGNFGSSILYSENATPIPITSTGTISDIDSPNLDTGQLTIQIGTDGSVNDQLSIRNLGSISTNSFSQVLYSGVVMGTYSGGVGQNPLQILLNSSSTPLKLQSLLRNIVYSNSSELPAPIRTVTAQLTDGDSGTSQATSKSVEVVSIPDPPVITDFGSPIAFTENSSPILISTISTVTDIDSSNFNLGTLTIKASLNAKAEDRFTIRTAGNISTNLANEVLYAGIVIGNIAGGIGTSPLVVSLNANATSAKVQAVLRNVIYQNVSDNPSALPRTVWARLTDGNGGNSTPVTKILNIVPTNDRPIIGDFGPEVSYIENALPLLISPTSTLVDIDSLNFDSGSLTIKASVNAKAEDRFVVRTAGNISTNPANEILYAGVVIGNMTGGTGTLPLVVNLNALATPPKVQALIRNVSYLNVSDNPSAIPRTVWVQVTDGDGGTSISVTKKINVLPTNDAPVLSEIDGTVAYTNLASPIFVGTSSGSTQPTATVTDVDSFNFDGGKLTVRISSGGHASNRIELSGIVFTIDANNNLLRNGTVIGLLNANAGVGFSKFEVTFNSLATAPVVQQLLRCIKFRTTNNSSVMLRTISFTLTDGDLGTSSTLTKIINVH